MSKSTFGERLRREREMRGVGLEEIATATRISTRFLEALETEHWERLPGGVFNRGFIRAVARYLGLDEESLLAEYAGATNDQPEVAVWATEAQRPRRQSRPWLAALLAIVVLAGGGYIYWQYAPRLVGAWRAAVSNAPASRPTARPDAVGAKPALPTPRDAEKQPEVVPQTPAKQGIVTETTPLELKIDVGRATSLTVVADGKTLFDGRIEAGQQQRFQAKEKFEISARDSGAVLLEMNGQTMPPLGPPGSPGRITLTRRDLERSPGGQDF